MSATLVLVLLALLAPRSQDAPRTAPVGMTGRIAELVLHGPELEAAPAEPDAALILRVTRTSPHGSDFRYDLEWYALDPGDYDLRDYLRRVDGAELDRSPAGVAPIPVRAESVLPPGQVEPHAPAPGHVPAFGGYRTLLIAAGLFWLLGLAAILLVGRKRAQVLESRERRPRTLAERLRPLVESALAGTLSRSDRAQLELGLVALWRRRLGLEQEDPDAALATLHAHAEAGPLLKSLEDWLHAPTPPRDVDVGALLAPYKDLPEDALGEL